MPTEITKSINGIYIDPVIFIKKISIGCNIEKCKGICCFDGAFIDKEEQEKVLLNKDVFIAAMDKEQVKDPDKWFGRTKKDQDYKSGLCIETKVYNNKCVFMNKNNHCVLQKAAINQKIAAWSYKPIFCILFPLTIENKVLTIDTKHINLIKEMFPDCACGCPDSSGKTFFEYAENELRFFFKESFEVLLQYRNEFLEQSYFRA